MTAGEEAELYRRVYDLAQQAIDVVDYAQDLVGPDRPQNGEQPQRERDRARRRPVSKPGRRPAFQVIQGGAA